MLWINNKYTILELEQNMRNAGGSYATFISIPYKDIPEHIFY